jgi:NAD(P)H dehydrogenase (quinone)
MLIDTAVACGVQQVVYTSFFSAAPDATSTLARDHWATEQRLREAKLSVTFLRDNLYLDFFPFMIGEDGVIRGPAGRGRVASVARTTSPMSLRPYSGIPAPTLAPRMTSRDQRR